MIALQLQLGSLFASLAESCGNENYSVTLQET